MESESRERAAHNIGYIEGRIDCYNEIIEIISIMMRSQYVTNYDISVRTLETLTRKIMEEVLI